MRDGIRHMDNRVIRKTLTHPDRPGAGATARRGLTPDQKVHAVMAEHKRGTLRSGGSGKVVTNRKQAIAIGLSEAGLSRPRRRRR